MCSGMDVRFFCRFHLAQRKNLTPITPEHAHHPAPLTTVWFTKGTPSCILVGNLPSANRKEISQYVPAGKRVGTANGSVADGTSEVPRTVGALSLSRCICACTAPPLARKPPTTRWCRSLFLMPCVNVPMLTTLKRAHARAPLSLYSMPSASPSDESRAGTSNKSPITPASAPCGTHERNRTIERRRRALSRTPGGNFPNLGRQLAMLMGGFLS